MRDDPAKPLKAIAGGQTCTWAAGGEAVVCEERTVGEGGGWEGVYILSYDPVGKQYHVDGTQKPGTHLHAVGRFDGARWVWVTDPASNGSRTRYSFDSAFAASRTMTVDAGAPDHWATIVTTKYTRAK
jgi:hypothetical protein